MTNEVIKRPSSEPVTIENNANQALYKNCREWREYASALEEDVKNLSERVIELDEHILKVENENSFLRDERTTFDSNGKSVEPIITQQGLPVVPEFVGLGISEDIQLNTVVADVLTTVITSDDKDLKEYGLWIKENLVTYVIARTLGYQVEKPQLFFLKHIDMSKRNSTNDVFLHKYIASTVTGNEGRLEHLATPKGKYPKEVGYKFTQAEIDSMQTGSYEQIEVAE